MIDRSSFINLMHASYVTARYDYSRSLAADWLAAWPNDAEILLLLAEAELKDGTYAEAITRLHKLIEIDPELGEAYELLAKAYYDTHELQQAQDLDACRALLQREKIGKAHIPDWVRPLDRSLKALEIGNSSRAVSQAQEAIKADPDYALPTLIYIKSLLADDKTEDGIALARIANDRWPDCLYFRFILAKDMMNKGKVQRGVDRLHRIAADDPTGRLANKYLGEHHYYVELWPKRLSVDLSRPVPAEVRAIVGGNRIEATSRVPGDAFKASKLSDSDSTEKSRAARIREKLRRTRREQPKEVTVAPEPNPKLMRNSPIFSTNSMELPVAKQVSAPAAPAASAIEVNESAVPTETIRADDEHPQIFDVHQTIAAEFERLGDRLIVHLPKTSKSVHVLSYLVLSCKEALLQKFGEEKFSRLDEALDALVDSVARRPGWKAHKLYIDDRASMQALGLTPVDVQNPWQIKLRIADVDRALQAQGEMIGALFIIGGNEIVPFHMLPNPTDDDDESIPSDNPYATTDANYFAPQWPVGRLPSDNDLDFMVRFIRSSADEHHYTPSSSGFLLKLQYMVSLLLNRVFRKRIKSLGYTANIWRKASLAVYRAIGTPRSLISSPPAEVGSLNPQLMRPAVFSYYNLHGLEDAPEWFGQKDPFNEIGSAGPDFPVALRPVDIVNSGRAPRIVFTEACYGANILSKSSETAICLKFLESGSRAVVGSTKISYGSVTPPLIAADLLGRNFWDHVVRGIPVGEALRRSKLQLASDMHRRQGYLDGEDQKTLISFILYGDPLLASGEFTKRSDKSPITRKAIRPAQMKTVCALAGPDLSEEDLEPLVLEKVRSIVADYLPGMFDASCKVHSQLQTCDGSNHACPTHQLKLHKSPEGSRPTIVVTFSKHVPDGTLIHPHYARLTLDDQGKVLKLAVSR